MALLWRSSETAASRGPRPGLSTGRVVNQGVAIADSDGLGAVTMRRVGQQLGVATMNLYSYVPGKDELVTLMLDVVLRDMPRSPRPGGTWRERLTAVAQENRAMYAAHPWAAEAAPQRPTLGPGVMAKYEHELSAFEGTGLSDEDTDAALTFLLDFVAAAARSAAAVGQTPGEDAQWWATFAPLLATQMEEGSYPLSTRIGSAAGAAHGTAYDPDHAYHFGLERVLDGLATLIEGNRSP